MIKLTAKNYKNAIVPSRRKWALYSTQVLNLANSTAQSTKPKYVGPVVNTFQTMVNEQIVPSLENWTNYYNSQFDEANLIVAGKKTYEMLQKQIKAAKKLTEEDCIEYVKEIVYNKTHMGNAGQYCAAESLSSHYNLPIRWPTPEEDSAGQIDLWLGEFPVQVKPHNSAFKSHVHNHADTDKHLFVTYEKKNGKWITYIHNPEFMKSSLFEF
jgi:hypothetical protein